MKAKIKYIIAAVIVLVIVVFSYVFMLDKKEVVAESVLTDSITSKEPEKESDTFIYVDIKGSVKKPGVYKVSSESIVNDVITLAGGFTKNAYTKNINLSKKVKDEMVIYIFSKNEMTTKETISIKNDTIVTTEVINYDNCIKNEVTEEDTNSSLVNINTASKEELMSISGIGSSKADLIITYRQNTPFTKIEDIMNVSGIGENLFEKIKKYITV